MSGHWWRKQARNLRSGNTPILPCWFALYLCSTSAQTHAVVDQVMRRHTHLRCELVGSFLTEFSAPNARPERRCGKNWMGLSQFLRSRQQSRRSCNAMTRTRQYDVSLGLYIAHLSIRAAYPYDLNPYELYHAVFSVLNSNSAFSRRPPHVDAIRARKPKGGQ